MFLTLGKKILLESPAVHVEQKIDERHDAHQHQNIPGAAVIFHHLALYYYYIIFLFL